MRYTMFSGQNSTYIFGRFGPTILSLTKAYGPPVGVTTCPPCGAGGVGVAHPSGGRSWLTGPDGASALEAMHFTTLLCFKLLGFLTQHRARLPLLRHGCIHRGKVVFTGQTLPDEIDRGSVVFPGDRFLWRGVVIPSPALPFPPLTATGRAG